MSYPCTQGRRASAAGSNRHSRWFRSTITEPGISPSAARCPADRMSISVAPVQNSANASPGVTRVSRDRAAARISSIERAPAGLEVTNRLLPRFRRPRGRLA